MRINITHSLAGAEQLKKLRSKFDEAGFNAGFFPAENSQSTNTEFYSAVHESCLHVVFNMSEIDNASANQIMGAMIKKITIIFLYPPRYNNEVSYFSRNLINSRLSKLIVLDFLTLDNHDFKNIINSTSGQETNYVLTKHEQTMIKSHIKQQVRNTP